MFKTAKPVFLKNLENEMNITAFFAANFDCSGENAKLLITGATYYRITVNGEFAGYGPARAPKGFTRVDEIDITPFVTWGLNQIVIEVASYNCRNFACLKTPGFLQAEIIADGNVVAATGFNFIGFMDVERVQKVMRYSYQRTFSEVYNRKGGSMIKVPVEVVDPKLSFMLRKAPFPNYDIVSPVSVAYTGNMERNEDAEIPSSRFINDVGNSVSDGFKLKDIEFKPLYDMFKTNCIPHSEKSEIKYPYTLKKGEYMVFDMGKNTTGFIRHRVNVVGNSRMILGVTERDTKGKFLPMENDLTNVIDYHMIGGEYEGETFEVFGFKFLYVFILEGEVTIDELSVREYVYPLGEIPEIHTDNQILKGVYNAAAETFRQNTLDVFMDCPTRERAGWFMDSVFTARSEYFFTKSYTVNESMLNNIVVATGFECVPEGLFPMCYPADVLAGEYIPQWCLWYGVQVYEQIKRSGKSPEKYRKVLYGVYDWFKKHENSDGLVEKLEGWNFIEWSKCNDWVQDINYPTNMMYCYFMQILGEMYEDIELSRKAVKLKEKIIEKSFNGKYFEERAVYGEDGIAKNTDDVSETCQYYAIWTGVCDINDEKYKDLKYHITKTFGALGTHDFYVPYEPANFMNGVYLRIDILLKMNEKELLLNEIEKYFGHMAELTGTIWEHTTESNSLNHGFASWLGEVIYKCLE